MRLLPSTSAQKSSISTFLSIRDETSLFHNKSPLPVRRTATMTSSLASQLARISAASTNTLNTRKLKAIHSTSLIFEPSHAATQDLETVYTIAQEGFQELCLLDERFFVFERGLFSESSKDVDRFLLTRGEVKELNASIEAFLQLVSGRLLLKPAMKAVEWLVRRFRFSPRSPVSTQTPS